jgi:hypothetical protein
MSYMSQDVSLPGAVAHEIAHAYYDRYIFATSENYGLDLSHDFAIAIENGVRGASGLGLRP